MADQVEHSPTQHEMTHHVGDYGRFVGMMKWGAILSFITGIAVMMFVL
jgi:hypothetical protein